MEINYNLISEIALNLERSRIKSQEHEILNSIPKDLFKNESFVLNALSTIKKPYHAIFMEYVPFEIINNKEIALKLIEINPLVIKNFTFTLKNDEEVILSTIKPYPHGLSYASEQLKNNKSFILKAIDVLDPSFLGICYDYYFKYKSNDREIALKIVEKYGFALRDLDSYFRDDNEIVKQALKKSAGAIEFVSDRLKDDKEIALLAVKKNGRLIEYVSDRLKGHPEIALEAFLNNKESMLYFSENLKLELKGKDIVDYLQKAAMTEALKDELPVNGKNVKKIKV